MKWTILLVSTAGNKNRSCCLQLRRSRACCFKSGYGNLLIHYDTAITHIDECITACKTTLAGHTCKGISLGLAGSKALSKEEIKKYFYNRYQVEVGLYDDAIIAHEALLSGKDGILTIAGTGAVGIGKKTECTNTAEGGDIFLEMKEADIGLVFKHLYC